MLDIANCLPRRTPFAVGNHNAWVFPFMGLFSCFFHKFFIVDDETLMGSLADHIVPIKAGYFENKTASVDFGKYCFTCNGVTNS